MITNWMGDDAFLRERSMLGRRPVAYGDVCWIHGQVTEKFQRGDENLVKIIMAYDSQKWRASRPAPDQPIPIWLGGASEASFRRAGRLGDG